MPDKIRSARQYFAAGNTECVTATSNIELGRHGRSRSNVWHYAGVNTFRARRWDVTLIDFILIIIVVVLGVNIVSEIVVTILLMTARLGEAIHTSRADP